jgi:DNA-binding XRE family transcriptional regulator
MMSHGTNVVDLDRERRVRGTLDDLVDLLKSNERLSDRWDDLVVGHLTSPDLEDPIMPNDATITLRLPVDDLDRADELVPLLEQVPHLRAARVSRSLVLRLALYEGLAVLEKQYGAPATVQSPKPQPATVKPAKPKPTKVESVPDDTDPASAFLGQYQKPSRRTTPTTAAGEQLRAWREGVPLTQAEAAVKLGCGQSTYSPYETGKRVPTAKRAREIEALTGIPASAWTAE